MCSFAVVGESARAVTKMWHHIECAVLYYAYSGVQKFTVSM